MKRRSFIHMGGAVAGAFAIANPLLSEIQPGETNPASGLTVKFTSDGLDLSPFEYSQLLVKLSQEGKFPEDTYSQGGVVETMEKKFAGLLGKESAIFMPTGTLANQIALRKLAGENKRVIVQAESHVYNDTGDSSQTLSGLNLIPLAPGKTGFTLEDVRIAVQKAETGRVETNVGVISIESPVRRVNNEQFSFDEMKKISAYAREKNIRMHFDGARMFNMPFHSGKSIQEYASLFDTVYVSLYKCFNAASGAVLAGSKSFTEGMYHTRRMFGGGLPKAWPFASVVLKYADSYLDEYAKAWKNLDAFISLAGKNPALSFEKIAEGTSVFKMNVKLNDTEKFIASLKSKNILIPHPVKNTGTFLLRANTTCSRMPAEILSKHFIESLN